MSNHFPPRKIVYGYSKNKFEEEQAQLTPGEGYHWLTTESGYWVIINRRIRGNGGATRQESLTCFMLGGRARMDDFIRECRDKCRARDAHRTLVYSGGEHGSWNMAQAKVRRPLHTVMLVRNVFFCFCICLSNWSKQKEEKQKHLVGDAKEFLESETW